MNGRRCSGKLNGAPDDPSGLAAQRELTLLHRCERKRRTKCKKAQTGMIGSVVSGIFAALAAAAVADAAVTAFRLSADMTVVAAGVVATIGGRLIAGAGVVGASPLGRASAVDAVLPVVRSEGYLAAKAAKPPSSRIGGCRSARGPKLN